MPRCCHSHWCQCRRLAWSLRRAVGTDFPSEIDQLLLSVAANHAAAAFQNARLRHELDAKVAELRQVRNELETKVSERTADLRRSEAYLAEAQRLTHTGSWACDIVTREMRHSSEEHSRLYGFDPERGIPSFEEFLQRIHPEDRPRVVETPRGRNVKERISKHISEPFFQTVRRNTCTQ